MTAGAVGSAILDACPVCRAPAPRPFLSLEGRDYWRCAICEARFLDPRYYPSREAERAHYLHHENRPDDPQYRRFLSKIADPLMERLEPGARGLDYGCGPGPALAAMLKEAGHPMALYDPFFHPDPAVLNWVYDFVTCTETAEHFHHPAEEFDRLGGLLRPGGWLAIMTCFQTEDERFADWRYRRDPTHVVFYREATMRFIAGSRGWACEVPAKDVALMRKPPEA
ncbi:class I SAM-dependent methyltransferase [Chelativorans alearense]|uniref:class I SAM-dependent methyltransferase n=1 Tax=Chelativorans alearense TaxID=2681495 RepID=UPI0013D220BF|nr:class I SAM-dependent methyltransferase [Chelativorans alearense]